MTDNEFRYFKEVITLRSQEVTRINFMIDTLDREIKSMTKRRKELVAEKHRIEKMRLEESKRVRASLAEKGMLPKRWLESDEVAK